MVSQANLSRYSTKMITAVLGKGVLKHLVQNSSLLGHLAQSSLLGDNTTYVEFGSGRGALSYHLTQVTYHNQPDQNAIDGHFYSLITRIFNALMYIFNMLVQIYQLCILFVTQIASMPDTFMYRLNMPSQICLV